MAGAAGRASAASGAMYSGVPLARGRGELRVLHVKRLDARRIGPDIADIVHALEDEVGRVVEDVNPPVIARGVQKSLEADAVVQVLAGMDLVGQVDVILLRDIQDRTPQTGQLRKPLLHQPQGPLRPRVDKGPQEGATERGQRPQTKVAQNRRL